MFSNYNYYPQQTPSTQISQPNLAMSQSFRQAPPQLGLKGRLVSSLEEARATSIDFDGSIFYFPDLANKRIYTKQINVDGTASLLMYELKELPVDKEPAIAISTDQFITREELERVLMEFRQSLAQPTAPAPQKEILNF